MSNIIPFVIYEGLYVPLNEKIMRDNNLYIQQVIDEDTFYKVMAAMIEYSLEEAKENLAKVQEAWKNFYSSPETIAYYQRKGEEMPGLEDDVLNATDLTN